MTRREFLARFLVALLAVIGGGELGDRVLAWLRERPEPLTIEELDALMKRIFSVSIARDIVEMDELMKLFEDTAPLALRGPGKYIELTHYLELRA